MDICLYKLQTGRTLYPYAFSGLLFLKLRVGDFKIRKGVCVCVCVCVPRHSVVSDSLRPCGLKPARFLCLWGMVGVYLASEDIARMFS